MMNTTENFRHLFAYNEWANRRALDALKAGTATGMGKAVCALAHILIGEKMWLVRLLTDADTTRFDFWPQLSLDECEELLKENEQAYATFIADLSDESLDQTATYKNSRGIEYTTSYRDILTHVLFHSAYHRGQLAQSARAVDVAPAYTDYIAFVREREAKER
jgi:uncharacterized damage-inducible protein DinB